MAYTPQYSYPPQAPVAPPHHHHHNPHISSSAPRRLFDATAPPSSSSSSSPYSSSPSMAIPGVRQAPHDSVPPPLPPPRHIPSLHATLQQHQQQDMYRRGPPLPPASQLPHDDPAVPSSASTSSLPRRRKSPSNDDMATMHRDEGYASWSSNERSLDSFPSRFGLHSSFRFQSPADIHGDDMKKKLKPLRTTTSDMSTSHRSPSSSSLLSYLSDRDGPTSSSKYPPELAMPAVKLTHAASDMAVSPTRHHTPQAPSGGPYTSAAAAGPRLSIDRRPSSSVKSDLDRSPGRYYRSYRNNSDDASSQSTTYYDYTADDMDMDDVPLPPHKRLHMDDAYGHYTPATSASSAAATAPSSSKRRAASPSSTMADDSVSRRTSPVARLAGIAAPPTAALSRSDSYVSAVTMSPNVPAPATMPAATAVYDLRSPGAYSSGGVSPTSGNSPYTTPMSLNPSPRGSISMRLPPPSMHARNPSAAGTSTLAAPRLPELHKNKVHDFFMCDCCPKKPKKFETQEALRAHESEKQYNCSYCGNRFKNKNEAERHQNSLHVRRHSWSCSALSNCERAFHESSSRPGEADTCGYCGLGFGRSGVDAKGQRVATDQDWAERIRHLDDAHKFRECNSTKKFFRADHFRQHLKHSHAGSSGKWTNMLENACMIAEEPPTPR